MNLALRRKLVTRGYELHGQVARLNRELKVIKETLKAEALSLPGEHLPLAEPDSEGSQWLTFGRNCECRIVFPAHRLVTAWADDAPELAAIRKVAGESFPRLFERKVSFALTDKTKFRQEVAERLDEEKGIRLLTLCTEPSEPKAIWKAVPAPSPRPARTATAIN